MNNRPSKGFSQIRAFKILVGLDARICTSRFEYFGALWRRYKTKKPVKSTFYRLLNEFVIDSADRTGLEPATSAVTGRHSNQLNYRSLIKDGKDKGLHLKIKTTSFPYEIRPFIFVT